MPHSLPVRGFHGVGTVERAKRVVDSHDCCDLCSAVEKGMPLERFEIGVEILNVREEVERGRERSVAEDRSVREPPHISRRVTPQPLPNASAPELGGKKPMI